MKESIAPSNRAEIIFLPHGGGPLPLFNHPGHTHLVAFLRKIPDRLNTPATILLISAHWEETVATITSNERPSLIYDYYGFPKAAYQIQYPAPGDAAFANKLHQSLSKAGLSSRLDDHRGFDHGMYIPLTLMYPQAHIATVQLSLCKNLDAKSHIQMGAAIAEVCDGSVLVIGSGFSFHNLSELLKTGSEATVADEKNVAFEEWLAETCTQDFEQEQVRVDRLLNWQQAPHARYCHPRAEHLLPLHVCYGIAGCAAEQIFTGPVLGKQASAYLWNGKEA